jgi:hypothetical protein
MSTASLIALSAHALAVLHLVCQLTEALPQLIRVAEG